MSGGAGHRRTPGSVPVFVVLGVDLVPLLGPPKPPISDLLSFLFLTSAALQLFLCWSSSMVVFLDFLGSHPSLLDLQVFVPAQRRTRGRPVGDL